MDLFSFCLRVSAEDAKTISPLLIKITSSNILSISEIKCVEIITLAPSLKLVKIVSKI